MMQENIELYYQLRYVIPTPNFFAKAVEELFENNFFTKPN
jgi:hypothetical protein